MLQAGGYFGEVALINHAPRAADCVAASKLKVRRRSDSHRIVWPTSSDQCFVHTTTQQQKAAASESDTSREHTLQVLHLARDAFERLMGPAEKVLAERIREYETANSQAAGQSAATGQSARPSPQSAMQQVRRPAK